MCVAGAVATVVAIGIIKMYPSTIRRFSQTVGYVTPAPVHTPYTDPQLVMFLYQTPKKCLCLCDNPTHFLVFCSAHAFVTHIRSSQKAATAFCNLQCTGILADHRSQGRDSPVEEEEVDWHEEDDPGAVQPVKKGDTPQPPSRVLELKLPVPTRWSSLCYMIERCTVVTVVWHPFDVGCSCLFGIASVCEWSYFAFQIARHCSHTLMSTHGNTLSTYRPLSYQIGMH